MKRRGKAVAEAIVEYGPERFLGEMVDPDAEPLHARAAKMELLDLVAQAKKGERAAIFELEERTEGKGVGAAIRENLPGVKEGRKAMEEDAERRRKKAEAEAEAEAREGETVDEQIFQDALDERRKAIRERDKRRKGEARTEEEAGEAHRTRHGPELAVPADAQPDAAGRDPVARRLRAGDQGPGRADGRGQATARDPRDRGKTYGTTPPSSTSSSRRRSLDQEPLVAELADISVAFDILRQPAPTIQGGPDGSSGSMTFMVDLDDVPTFVREDLGHGRGRGHRRGDDRLAGHPPGAPRLPHHAGGRVPQRGLRDAGRDGDECLLSDVQQGAGHGRFRERAVRVRGGDAPYYTVSTDFSATKEIIPGSAYRFADGTKTNGDVSLDILEIAMVVTTYQSPAPVGAAIRAVIGRLNNAVFLDCPIGTVRFDGVKSEFSKTMFSTTYVKTFNLRYRERNWNEVVRPTGGWEAPVDVVTGATRYPLGNLGVLLQ